MKRAVAVSLCGITLGLAGCAASAEPAGGGVGGSAARSGVGRISQAELADEVGQVQAAMGLPTTQPAAGLTVANLERMSQNLLVDAQAARMGVTVTTAAVQQAVADLAASQGGMEALTNTALQAGIPPQSIEDVVRANLLVTEMGKQLVPSGDSNAQVSAVQQALVALSVEADLQVAPRYGTWDPAGLAIRDVSAVSRPAEAEAQTPQ